MKNAHYFLGWVTMLFVFTSMGTVKAQPSGFHLIKKTVVGGEGGWDYLMVDGENRRLYLSHGTQVDVLNVDTHEKIGVIPNLQGVHGIVVVPKSRERHYDEWTQ